MAQHPYGSASRRNGIEVGHGRRPDIVDLVQARVKRVLDLAELAIPADKFERFRTLVFNEFGHEGFRRDLAALLDHGGQSSMEGNGTAGTSLAGKVVRHECIRHLPYRIVIDLLSPPITDAELALIEVHMGAMIAAMTETDLPEDEVLRQALSAL